MIDEVANDLVAFGVDAATAAEMAGPAPQAIFSLWPENAEAMALFLNCSTQWHTTDGGPVGLRYESVLAVMALYEVKDKRAMLDDIRVMERSALLTFARK